ncbi:MAG: hypothetical protein ABI551_22755, partial [Polyangiaceae bacterium]
GAQYVASVDATVSGGLVELPRIGTPMIFASVDSAGRVSLLRSGLLLKFEAKTRRRSGVHARPNVRTPIAETGNPYEDEVATVKVRPHHLQLAASSAHQSMLPPARMTARPSFPHTQRSGFGVPGPAVRAIPIPKSAVND